MPPQLAIVIYIFIIIYLFWVDRNKTDDVSNAIWIPIIWMFLTASREVSLWLDLRPPVAVEEAYIEGNLVDRVIYLILMLAGAVTVIRRRLNWSALFTQNSSMWLFFVFGVISILWSDFPFVSFKRWVKALGNVIMVLIVLTEIRPYEAFGVILRRLAFVLLPLSVLFIKYYPELGRTYRMGGQPMFTGVASQKNGLGQICMLCGIYFSWNLLINCREKNELERLHPSIYLIILPMLIWLLYMANSATSLACLIVAVSLFGVARLPVVAREPGRVFTLTIACVAIFGLLDFFFNIYETVIIMLGRRPDLTTRVPMWRDLLTMVKNPLTGVGYDSFWLGYRLVLLTERWGGFVQAHNGYLQVYLDLGLIGLFLLICWIISGFIKIRNFLTDNYNIATLRLCIIIIVVLYNWTEATFYGISLMWIMFIFGVLNIPTRVPGVSLPGGGEGVDEQLTGVMKV